MTITLDEIRLLSPEITEQQNTQLIADTLSIGRIKLIERFVGIGTILAVMAPNGGLFLDALEALAPSNSTVKWALKLIEAGGMDVGMPATRQQLIAFAEQVPQLSTGIYALLSLAEIPDIVDEYEVRKLCWSAEGGWLV